MAADKSLNKYQSRIFAKEVNNGMPILQISDTNIAQYWLTFVVFVSVTQYIRLVLTRHNAELYIHIRRTSNV